MESELSIWRCRGSWKREVGSLLREDSLKTELSNFEPQKEQKRTKVHHLP